MSPYPGSQRREGEGRGGIKAFRSAYEWGDSFVTWVGGGAGEDRVRRGASASDAPDARTGRQGPQIRPDPSLFIRPPLIETKVLLLYLSSEACMFYVFCLNFCKRFGRSSSNEGSD